MSLVSPALAGGFFTTSATWEALHSWVIKEYKHFFGHTVRHAGTFVPRPGMEPMRPELGAQALNHWTAREVPVNTCLSPLEFASGSVP